MSTQKINEILANAKYLKGSNDSGVEEIQQLRKDFADKYSVVENSIDLVLVKTLYGRLDLQQNTIYPNKDKLVNLRSNAKETSDLVLPFVNDAYMELELKVSELIAKNKLKPNEILPFTAQTTYVNFENKYKENLTQLLEAFYMNAYNEGTINNILNFKDFINEFIRYVSISNISLSMTKYCISRGSISSTGLMIDTKKQKMDLDILKDMFYKNDNFNNYNKLLLSHGFSVDKYAPWRIIFNIDSKIAQSYMSKYGINNTEELFDNYYLRTYESELSNFISILLDYYNNKLLQIRPNSFIIQTKQTKNGVKTYFETKEKKPIKEEEIFNLIPELSFFKLYFYIRLKEESFNLSQTQFDNLMSQLTILYQVEGVNSVNEFVKNYTKPINTYGANPSLSLTRSTVTSYNNLNVHFRI